MCERVQYSRLKIFDPPETPTELGQKNGYQQERNMECPKDLAVWASRLGGWPSPGYRCQFSRSQQLHTDQGTASELISFPFPEPCRLAQIYRMMQPADCWFWVKPLFEVGIFLRLKFKSHNRRDTKSFKRVYSRVGDFLQVQDAVNSGHKNEQSWPLAQFAQLFGQRQRLRHVRQT